jgi:putative ABC transport system permease protein
VAEAALQVPGVLGVEAWSGTAAEILDSQGKLVENLSITAPAENTALLKAEMVAGRWLQPGDQRVLVLSSVIYKTFPDLQPGDRLRLRLASDNRIEDWTIAGVFSFTGMLGDLMGYASYDDIADRVGTPSETSSYRLITTAHTLESQEALCAAIDSHLSGLGMEVKSTVAGMKTRGEASTGINILIVFLLVMALLTAFVGSIGLTGTMGMNVLERTREIGVMRAIGAGDFAIIKSVVIEGVLIGLISWAAAWALSYPISAAMLKIISTAVESYPIELTYTFQGVFIWLGAVVVLATLASVLPARNAARLTIREVLAYE